ncbi:MAG: SusD/RagB family nutrient-binding outer membrane lipoprotein [Prolixibacteraceae bacterium]
MKRNNIQLLLVLILVTFISCRDLTELNENPNGVDPLTVNPNLVVPTVITATAMPYLEMGYNGDVAGVMQYVQKSGWGSGLNNFDWISERSWDGYYNNLRNIKLLLDRATTEGFEFHQGVALTLKAFTFGYIADGWGDAPYTSSLNAPAGGQADLFPVFDTQEMIYKGIIEDLKSANTLLSKPVEAYTGIIPEADVIYNGDPVKWRKLANSLMLRYYLRISSKLPELARSGVEGIIADPSTYPVFSSNDDDATMSYVGTANNDSWPANTTYDASESNYSRIQLGAGLRDVLVDLNDPRIGIWFNPVKVPIKVTKQYAPETDVKVNGVRYIDPDYMAANNMVIYNKTTWPADVSAGKILVDTMQYVGIPTAYLAAEPYTYNLNPSPKQGGYNDHVSSLSEMYKAAEGDLLKARLMSYAELCFILAESAKKGWAVGSQQNWYEEGIQASLNTWEIGGSYTSYIANPGVAYNGSLGQIMTQKWIANWTVAFESWCDWRRTGLPQLIFGPRGRRNAMPLRFRYDANEKNRNPENYSAAISNLVETPFTGQDGKDSSWSEFWLLQ